MKLEALHLCIAQCCYMKGCGMAETLHATSEHQQLTCNPSHEGAFVSRVLADRHPWKYGRAGKLYDTRLSCMYRDHCEHGRLNLCI